MLCGLGQMSRAFARIRRRSPTVRFLTTLTRGIPAALSLRIPALMLPHFLGMAFETPSLLVLPGAAKLLEPLLQVLSHRATRKRTAGLRLAGIFGSGHPGENQGGEQGNKDVCFHAPLKQPLPRKVALP